MKFDRRFPGVSETRRRFGMVSGVIGGGRVNKPQRGCNAGRCLLVWVDSATPLRSARNDCDRASGRVFQRAARSVAPRFGVV
jgi:hypothetical protein